jgi:uncharacterized protein
LSICFLASLSATSLAQTATKAERHPKTFKMDSITLKQCYFVMLTKGSRRAEITDTAVINKLQAGHMDNIKRLAAEGKILVAGPFGDDGNWRGIFIFDCDMQEEVEKLLATDPMIKAGRLSYELHPWWTGMNSVFK